MIDGDNDDEDDPFRMHYEDPDDDQLDDIRNSDLAAGSSVNIVAANGDGYGQASDDCDFGAGGNSRGRTPKKFERTKEQVEQLMRDLVSKGYADHVIAIVCSENSDDLGNCPWSNPSGVVKKSDAMRYHGHFHSLSDVEILPCALYFVSVKEIYTYMPMLAYHAVLQPNVVVSFFQKYVVKRNQSRSRLKKRMGKKKAGKKNGNDSNDSGAGAGAEAEEKEYQQSGEPVMSFASSTSSQDDPENGEKIIDELALPRVRLCDIPETFHRDLNLPTSVRSISASHLNKLTQLSGTVVRVGVTRSQEQWRRLQCSKCGYQFVLPVDMTQTKIEFKLPKRCPSLRDKACVGYSFDTMTNGTLIDFQIIKMQDKPGGVRAESDTMDATRSYSPVGIAVIMRDELADRVTAGDDVTICGLVERRWIRNLQPQTRCTGELILIATHLQLANEHKGELKMDPSMIRDYERFWSTADKVMMKAMQLAALDAANDDPMEEDNPEEEGASDEEPDEEADGDGENSESDGDKENRKHPAKKSAKDHKKASRKKDTKKGPQSRGYARERAILTKRKAQLQLRDVIVRSVCPQLHGMYLVKLIVAMTIIGGCSDGNLGSSAGMHEIDGDPDYDKPREARKSSVKNRSNSHLLMVGDAGTGKSQLLRFAAKVSTRSVLTTGIGSSSAGLTVTVCKESKAGGEWGLEAGALVLADGGLCCIDEFDSMKKAERASMHEAMEQQTLSVAKAGMICTLHCRTTVIAAINPKLSSSKSDTRGFSQSPPGGNDDDDDDGDLAINTNSFHIGMAAPLMSRFDVILAMKDVHNEERDEQLCDFILNAHGTFDNAEGFEEKERHTRLWTVAQLRGYFHHVKRRFRPAISKNAHVVLRSYYQAERRADSRNAARTTIRLLESLMRLTQAHARLMFRDTAYVQDAIYAIMAVESSANSANRLLRNSDALHADFPKHPYREFQRFAQLVLTALGLERKIDIHEDEDDGDDGPTQDPGYVDEALVDEEAREILTQNGSDEKLHGHTQFESDSFVKPSAPLDPGCVEGIPDPWAQRRMLEPEEKQEDHVLIGSPVQDAKHTDGKESSPAKPVHQATTTKSQIHIEADKEASAEKRESSEEVAPTNSSKRARFANAVIEYSPGDLPARSIEPEPSKPNAALTAQQTAQQNALAAILTGPRNNDDDIFDL